jgi:hypothetical protein
VNEITAWGLARNPEATSNMLGIALLFVALLGLLVVAVIVKPKSSR